MLIIHDIIHGRNIAESDSRNVFGVICICILCYVLFVYVEQKRKPGSDRRCRVSGLEESKVKLMSGGQEMYYDSKKTLKSKIMEKTMIRESENRRSIRKYRSDEIDRKLIEEDHI